MYMCVEGRVNFCATYSVRTGLLWKTIPHIVISLTSVKREYSPYASSLTQTGKRLVMEIDRSGDILVYVGLSYLIRSEIKLISRRCHPVTGQTG